MKKEHAVWTAISEQTHKTLSEISAKTGMTMTKIVKQILFINPPKEIVEEYRFTTKKSRRMVIKMSDLEFEKVEKMAQQHKISISRFIRNVVYSYLLEKGLA
ncbi:MAG: hypothetical protein PWP45_716 [Tepidanaerobacteraceae bacterium]|nr:hypothetical protein [Tepidanaerobacteraceae bacterium]